MTIAMLIVNFYGASTSKLVFAMLGAMVTMEPAFKDSLKACWVQIVGVFFGGLLGVIVLFFPMSPLAAAVIGIVILITTYNILHIRFSPSLSCLILVIVCTTPDIDPLFYALERIWDTAIGLGVGILINLLVFPYDNSRQIRKTAESLDKELLLFLEDMFDGDNTLPNTEKMVSAIDCMKKELTIFSNQWFLLHRRRRRRENEAFRVCEGKARQLVAQMEVLSRMEKVGILDEPNRRQLSECGANIRDNQNADSLGELDIVTNYHVRQLLVLRRELLETLEM